MRVGLSAVLCLVPSYDAFAESDQLLTRLSCLRPPTRAIISTPDGLIAIKNGFERTRPHVRKHRPSV